MAVNEQVLAAAREKAKGRVKLKDLNPPNNYLLRSDYEEYIAMAINSIKIDCTDPNIQFGYLEEDFIKRELIKSNIVGYDRLTNQWAIVYGFGINNYWRPTRLTFVLPTNRASFTRPASYEPDPIGAYFIKGLPANVSFNDIISKATDFMALCDNVIVQNLGAVRTPYVVVAESKEMQLSLLQAVQERQQGEPVVVVGKPLAKSLEGVQTYTEYIADKVETLKDQRRDQLLNKIGTMTANINKRERVQVGEVNATVGQCEDYIYMLIDNVNRQFTEYGLPFEMKLNTSLEELYTDDSQDGDGTQSAPEQGEEEEINNA